MTAPEIIVVAVIRRQLTLREMHSRRAFHEGVRDAREAALILNCCGIS
jgi:hypothetical protein